MLLKSDFMSKLAITGLASDSSTSLANENKYTIKDSFSFAKEVEEFDANLVMASFYVKLLFTNIPHAEAIGLCVDNLYRNQTHIDSVSKSYFQRLLEMTMFESFFIFNQKYYNNEMVL